MRACHCTAVLCCCLTLSPSSIVLSPNLLSICSQRFHEGYLVKSVAIKSLAAEEETPALDELQRFTAAAQVRARA